MIEPFTRITLSKIARLVHRNQRASKNWNCSQLIGINATYACDVIGIWSWSRKLSLKLFQRNRHDRNSDHTSFQQIRKSEYREIDGNIASGRESNRNRPICYPKAMPGQEHSTIHKKLPWFTQDRVHGLSDHILLAWNNSKHILVKLTKKSWSNLTVTLLTFSTRFSPVF